MIAAILMTVAIVAEDGTPLRAAPDDLAPRQAELWRGDWLEVRGERAGYVQVWDHRHERPGYVRAWRVRSYAVDEAAAPELRAIMLFLRDAPGMESLGIAYAAMYMRAAPATSVGSEVFDAIGTMADRLARRISAPHAGPQDKAVAAYVDVATSYGLGFASVEREDGSVLCYDGEAFRRVLAMPAAPAERARAALALTREDTLERDTNPVAVRAFNEWRRSVLERADPVGIPDWMAGRLRLRRSEVLAALAYDYGRAGDESRAKEATGEALRQLMLVDRKQLLVEDAAGYDGAALRVAANAWVVGSSVPGRATTTGPALRLDPGEPGQTCLKLMDRSGTKELVSRCTYGRVTPVSVCTAPRGAAFTVAVQPLPAWTEIWVVHRGPDGWQIDSLLPAVANPATGYVELAGFSPDGSRLLVAREAIVSGKLERSFDIVRTDTLAVEKHAPSLDSFPSFRKWASPSWKAATLALR